MSKKDVRCVVLSVGEGPQCAACSQPMDAVQVTSKGHKHYGKRGHYCFHCSIKG